METLALPKLPTIQPQPLELEVTHGRDESIWEAPRDYAFYSEMHPASAASCAGLMASSPQQCLASLAKEIRLGFQKQESMLKKLLDQQGDVLLMHRKGLVESSNSAGWSGGTPIACTENVVSFTLDAQAEKDSKDEDDLDRGTFSRQSSPGSQGSAQTQENSENGLSMRNSSNMRQAEQEKMRSHARNRATMAKSTSSMSPVEVPRTAFARWRANLRDTLNRTDVTLFIFFIIASNAAYVGVEVQVTRNLPLSKVPEAFRIINYAYTSFFTIEVGLKLFAFGPREFFAGTDKTWNAFDFFIVLSALAEAFFSSQIAMGHLRVFRSLRIVRIFRTIRVVRILKFMSSLRNLLLSIMNTLKALVWTVLLVCLVFYGVGVALAQACSDFCREEAIERTGDPDVVPDCENDAIDVYWSDLPTSMFTLFKAITSGVSWHDVVTPLMPVGEIWVFLFILYVGFMMFAVLNVVTGVFCQTAIESAAADKEMATMRQLQNRQKYVESIKCLFSEIDDDGSNEITIDEFEEKLVDEGMVAFFDSIDVDTQDAWLLFTLIDKDKSGSVDLEEFVEGCLQLKGSAKAIHIAKLSADNRSIRHSVDTIEEAVLDLVDVEKKHRLLHRRSSVVPKTIST